MKAANSWVGGSFQGEFTTTARKLIALAEKLDADYTDNNNGSDKSNFDFEFLTDSGQGFTLYDWKHYRPLDLDELVEFHIGGERDLNVDQVKKELKEALSSLKDPDSPLQEEVITVRVTARVTKDIEVPISEVKEALEEDGGSDLNQKAVELANKRFNILNDDDDESYDQDGFVVEL